MKSIVLLFLGALFVINIFFRVRLMKIFKQIKTHQLQISMSDLLVNNKFNHLVNSRYPEHADLLNNYRRSMFTGLMLMIIVVVALTLFIILRS